VLSAGESLVCDGSNACQVRETSGVAKSIVTLATPLPMLATGTHTVTLDSEREGDAAPRVELQFKGLRQIDQLRASRSSR